MINQLQSIKEQLFDAPREVKESFNNLVEYFGKEDKNTSTEELDYRSAERRIESQGFLSVSEMRKLEGSRKGGKGSRYGFYNKFAELAKIPQYDSLIAIDNGINASESKYYEAVSKDLGRLKTKEKLYEGDNMSCRSVEFRGSIFYILRDHYSIAYLMKYSPSKIGFKKQ